MTAHAELAAVTGSGESVVFSDAFDDPAVRTAAESAHRHAFADVATLTALFAAHRTARRIVVATGRPDDVRALCEEQAAILISL